MWTVSPWSILGLCRGMFRSTVSETRYRMSLVKNISSLTFDGTAAWFHHSCLNVWHRFVQQMTAGRHSAPQQLCLLTSSVINGGYKVNGNDILHHYKLFSSLWQHSDPQVIWKCLLFSWFLLEPVSLCVGAVCGCDMAQSGFFMRNGDYLCPLDFQRLHGTPCNNCREFVEGEVVTVLGKTYHPACFVCNNCK